MRYLFGDCVLDDEARELRRRGVVAYLSPKAFELLVMLLERRPNAVAKAEIQDRVWPSTFVSAANLPSLVKEVRAAIGDDARAPTFLRTTFGHGYAFFGEVRTEASEARPLRAVGVLPLAADGPDGEDFAADGLTEGLINALSKLDGVRVVPRSTAFRYRHRTGESSVVARELKVQALVVGRLRRRGERLNVQLELVDAATSSQVWGEQLELHESELLAAVELLAGRIAQRLGLRAPGPPVGREQASPARREAYRLYLKGRFHWNRRTPLGMEKAIELFRAAIESDASFAPAHAGLADAYLTLGSRDLLAPREVMPLAKHAALAALALDPLLAEAHASLAAIFDVFELDREHAEREFQSAIELDPRSANAHHWYALFLARSGRHEQAVAELARMVEGDPSAEQSVIMQLNSGLVHYLARDYAPAVAAAERAVELEPLSAEGLFVLGLARLQQGRAADAIAALARASELSGDHTPIVASHAHACAVTGRQRDAERILASLAGRAVEAYVSSAALALVHVGLGQLDRALELFEKALRERSGWLVLLPREPRLDPLRSRPRFQALLREIEAG